MRAHRGRAWETRLALWHDAYRRERRALVFKTQPPAKLLNGRLVYTKKGAPDFVGTIADGRAIVLEAKSCERRRWPYSLLAPHQASALESAHLLGAISVIALRLGTEPWLIHWGRLRASYWAWREGGGPASLSVADLADLAEPIPADGWLSLVTG